MTTLLSFFSSLEVNMVIGVLMRTGEKKYVDLEDTRYEDVEMWRGPDNLLKTLMIWGSRIWGCGVDLYTTPSLIAPCGILICSHVGLRIVRTISTDPGTLFRRIPRHLCTLLPAVLEFEVSSAWFLGFSGGSDSNFARLSLRPASGILSEAFVSEEWTTQTIAGPC